MRATLHTIATSACKVHVVIDDVNSQVWATIAAMFSRSNDGVEAIVEKVTPDRAGKFIENFYIGYSHESIGDLVDVRLFVEGVPFYVAALIEHHALFRGQESSTRYIDFATQPPCHDADLERHRAAVARYVEAVGLVRVGLERAARDRGDTLDGGATRALNARAFDFCRGLLPLSSTTNVAWYGSVRSMKGHLAWMHERFSWAQPYTHTILAALRDVYPQSFGGREMPSAREPWVMGPDEGDYVMQGALDFGSWRDLNRHRVGHHTFLSPTWFFHPWYAEMLAAHGAEHLLPPLSGGDTMNDYFLGSTGRYCYSMPREQSQYVVRLRSRVTVHPTLRAEVLNFADEESEMGAEYDMDDTPDPGPNGYVLVRGDHAITVRDPET